MPPLADDSGEYVYLLAKELKVSNERVLDFCRELHFTDIIRHHQRLTVGQERAVRARIKHLASLPPPPPPPPPEPPPPPVRPNERPVYQLAKELDVTNGHVLAACAALGFEGVWLHHHTLTPAQEVAVRNRLKNPPSVPPPAAPTPLPPKASEPPPPPTMLPVAQPQREAKPKAPDLIRIFRLAADLKVENKLLIDICQELGFEKVKNQLNSLTPEQEAQVRKRVAERIPKFTSTEPPRRVVPLHPPVRPLPGPAPVAPPRIPPPRVQLPCRPDRRSLRCLRPRLPSRGKPPSSSHPNRFSGFATWRLIARSSSDR